MLPTLYDYDGFKICNCYRLTLDSNNNFDILGYLEPCDKQNYNIYNRFINDFNKKPIDDRNSLVCNNIGTIYHNLTYLSNGYIIWYYKKYDNIYEYRISCIELDPVERKVIMKYPLLQSIDKLCILHISACNSYEQSATKYVDITVNICDNIPTCGLYICINDIIYSSIIENVKKNLRIVWMP